MAVTQVGSPTENSGNLSSGFIVSATVAAGSNRLLIATWHSSAGTALTSVAWNGTGLSLVASTGVTNGDRTEIWELEDPEVVSANLVFSHSGGMHHSGGKAIQFNGAIAASDGNTNSPSASPSSITVSNVVSGDFVVDAISIGNDPTEGADQTGLPIGSSGGNFFEASYQDGTNGGVMSWTFTDTSGAHSACRIPAAAAAGGPRGGPFNHPFSGAFGGPI